MTDGVRRYKEVMLWFHRDERIQRVEETRRKGEIPVEYYDAIDSVSLPSHLGNRINIIIGLGK
jgi:hypothetical protein